MTEVWFFKVHHDSPTVIYHYNECTSGEMVSQCLPVTWLSIVVVTWTRAAGYHLWNPGENIGFSCFRILQRWKNGWSWYGCWMGGSGSSTFSGKDLNSIIFYSSIKKMYTTDLKMKLSERYLQLNWCCICCLQTRLALFFTTNKTFSNSQLKILWRI